ncbi:MAG: hypothetical protein V4662_20500 [Verrucomicrobiota bacterium]
MPEFSWSQELIRGGITVASVAIGGWIALRNYRSNAWWEAKRKAYEEVIGALEECGTSYQQMANARHDTSVEALSDKIETARIRIFTLKRQSTFLMSDEALTALDSLVVQELGSHMKSDDEVAKFRALQLHYDGALNAFVLASRVDLGVAGLPTRIKHGWMRTRASTRSLWSRTAPARAELGPKAQHSLLCIWFGDAEAARRKARGLEPQDDGKPTPAA